VELAARTAQETPTLEFSAAMAEDDAFFQDLLDARDEAEAQKNEAERAPADVSREFDSIARQLAGESSEPSEPSEFGELSEPDDTAEVPEASEVAKKASAEAGDEESEPS